MHFISKLILLQEQYMLIHDALVEYLLSHDTEVRNGEINKYIQNLTKFDDNNSSQLQKQYEVCKLWNLLHWLCYENKVC